MHTTQRVTLIYLTFKGGLSDLHHLPLDSEDESKCQQLLTMNEDSSRINHVSAKVNQVENKPTLKYATPPQSGINLVTLSLTATLSSC